jgi:hypothetical protein
MGAQSFTVPSVAFKQRSNGTLASVSTLPRSIGIVDEDWRHSAVMDTERTGKR